MAQIRHVKDYALYFSIALLVGLAMGIINPLATTHMMLLQTGGLWIGVISSAYFVFLAAGALTAFFFLRGGNIRPFMIAGLLLAAVAALIFPLVKDVWLWLLLMSVMGIGISFNMTGVQTLLHSLSNHSNRSFVSGIYSVVFALGFSVSTLAGTKLYTMNAAAAFMAGAACLATDAAAVAIFTKNILNTAVRVERQLMSRVRTSMAGAFIYGFSETTVVSIYPVFLLERGLSVGEEGFFIAIFVVGCLAGIIPITKLADRFGRKRVLWFCMLAATPLSIGIMVFNGFALNLLLSFLAGAAIGPIYPLAMSLAVEKLDPKSLPFGTSLFTFSYGAGSAFGPALTMLVMTFFGSEHIFSFSVVLFLCYLIVTGVRSTRQSNSEPNWEGIK